MNVLHAFCFSALTARPSLSEALFLIVAWILARFGPTVGPTRPQLSAAWQAESDNGNVIWCGTVWLSAAKSAAGKGPWRSSHLYGCLSTQSFSSVWGYLVCLVFGCFITVSLRN